MGLPHENNKVEIEKLETELALVKDVLGNLIVWLGLELGELAQQQLLDRLYPEGLHAPEESKTGD